MIRRFILSLTLTLAVSAMCSIAAAQDKSLAAEGKQLFTDQGCYGCHTIGNFGTPIAQDLSHLASKYSVDDLAKWLRDPASQKPTAHMPKINLTESEVKALSVYLGSLR